MRTAAALSSGNLTPRLCAHCTALVVSGRSSGSRKSPTRAKSACMVHPSGGSYSIWGMPKGDLAERLQQDIDRLAAEHEAPTFEPHVTLLGGTEQSEEDAVRITADLAQSLQTYRLDFQDVSYGKIFHQCVYVRCKPSDAAMDAAKRTRQAFGHPTDAEYMPHLSLLYSDIPSDTRAEIAAREQERMFTDYKMQSYGFDINTISLWYTIGEDKTLQSWRLVKEYPLQAWRHQNGCAVPYVRAYNTSL